MECTVNRVNNSYFDQLARSGHYDRPDDLHRFAELGIQALRYPVLWEHYEQSRAAGREAEFWQRSADRLHCLCKLGIRPIVGLVHHGSGPAHTSLVSPDFAEGLALYAAKVAEHFPWLEDYTPVNEPLTTARFSGLYGHWYPHGYSNQTFGQALVNQCVGTALAMQAIRQYNPQARLITTDDLGKTFSTPKMSYQADFDNARRWLSFDMLCGKLDRNHTLWKYAISIGIKASLLDWLVENPCPPDILGFNYYLTSERFLDERVELYPAAFRGGNGRDNYADVETVRVRAEGIGGLENLLREAWERYRRPVAVTEIHNGCSREEQLRWFWQCWQAAQKLRQEGADVRAVTAWALLGSFDWNTLVTQDNGYYEPGIFDLRAPTPRPTALSYLLKDLAADREPQASALLQEPGWWERPDRFIFGFKVRAGGEIQPVEQVAPTKLPEQKLTFRTETTLNSEPTLKTEVGPATKKVILISGARGTLGSAFARLCYTRGLPFVLLDRQSLDIGDPLQVEKALQEWQPWAFINAAGYVRVDAAEQEAALCLRENTHGPAILAAACAVRGVRLITFSSDLVFDGTKNAPYVESDQLNPLNVYGKSKAAAEKAVLDTNPDSLVIRTSAFFGPWDNYNFITQALQALHNRQPFRAAEDSCVSPTYVPDLVNGCLDLLLDGEKGIWHLANQGAISWAELALEAASLAGVRSATLISCPTAELGLAAPRPTYTVLSSERGHVLPSLSHALGRYMGERLQLSF